MVTYRRKNPWLLVVLVVNKNDEFYEAAVYHV